MPTDIRVQQKAPEDQGFRVTGRFVLIALILFFGTIMAMNAIMARFAVQTFAGLDATSSYKTGLAFSTEAKAARQQEALKWNVDAELVRTDDGVAHLRVDAKDAQGRHLRGMNVEAQLRHPTKAAQDRVFVMQETAPGVYEGFSEAAPGSWDLRVDILHAAERAFRSESRLMLK